MALIKRNPKQDRQRGQKGDPRKVSAYSYHNVRNDVEGATGRDPKRSILSQNKLSQILNRVGASIFLIVCLISLVSILSLSPTPHVVLVGNPSDSALFGQYKSSLLSDSQKLFAGSVLNRNKITVDTNGITSKLISEFPQFSQITITMPFIGQHPVIYVTQATPSLVLANTSGQYVINQNGVAVQRVTNPSSLGLPFVNDQSGLTVGVGDTALTTQDVSFIQSVNYQLAQKKYKITDYILPAGSSEVDVTLSGLPYILKFNLESNNPIPQVGRFLATANYLKSNNINPSSYIDVRTDGRVYYK
jgi:hypothetical protein